MSPRSSDCRRCDDHEWCGRLFLDAAGLVHPLVGLNLYVLSTISDAPIGEVIRGILPFLIILLLVLAVITYWPPLTMWLPDLVFGQ
jgi:TRAP-type C4-dicarboxylate transport system permease large subunit